MAVLNELYAGKKITIRFDSPQQRETFRQALYKVKKTQDDALLALDLAEQKQELRFEVLNHPVSEDDIDYLARLYLKDKKKEISFEIISVEENPMKEDDGGRGKEKVSKGMGEIASGAGEDSQSKDNFQGNDETNPQSSLERKD